MEILTSLALLACPVGMGLMMWFIMKGINGGGQRRSETRPLDALRAERARIDAELARQEEAAQQALPAERVL